MNNKEKIIQLLDSVPDYKMGYILAYVQGITAGEKLCENGTDSEKENEGKAY